MSSSRIVRIATQSSLLHTSTLFRASTSSSYSAYLINNARSFPWQTSSLGLYIPNRSISTGTQESKSPPTAPPPGLLIDKARKAALTKNIAFEVMDKKAAGAVEGHDSKSELCKDTQVALPKNDPAEALTQNTTGKDKDEEKDVKKLEKKMTLIQKIKKESQHYWDGTKLLAAEIRISTRLALKMAAGYELSRRENKQLQRTVQDIARLVPFSVFVLVPFAELLLPVALKLFPNMLPSTYEGQKSKDAKAKILRKTRKEVSNFLRDTLQETGLPLSPATAQKDEFTQFFRKLRATGESPSPTEVINVCKIFKDDLTLDNLSRPQLVGMCRYMNLNTFGTDMMLRYQIRHRMRQIKRDDRAISFEGVDSLSVPELQVACMSRGLRTHGASPGRLRDDLQTWLDLRLRHGVPSTLLVLSNAFMYASGKSDTEFHSQIDALTGVLSSIPEELFHEIELEVNSAEGAATNKQRLEVLKEQQDLIEEENEQDEENKESGRATPRDDEDIDEKEEKQTEAKVTAPEQGLANQALNDQKESVKDQKGNQK